MQFELLKQSHVKRNIIIGVVAVLIISAIVLTFTRAKYRVTQSIPLVNGTINYTLPDIQIVALYINGVEASELDSTKSYTLDTTQSTCTYKDGTTIDNLTLSYDSSSKTFTIAPYTTKGTKCTLYFEEYQPLLIEVVEEAYSNNTTTLAYDDYKNLRYIGANPNNYVLFNDELWRIIGIFSEDTHGVEGKKLIKIIRDESIGTLSWDSSSLNDWTTSSLQTVLNNDYLNGSGSYASTGIKSDTAKNMIETVIWNLGATRTYNNANNGLASHFYEYERGTAVYNGRPTEWSGKIALMYPSDYGYATSGGATANREACLTKELYNWDAAEYSDCINNNWIYSQYTQYTIMPLLNASSVFDIDQNGRLYYSGSSFQHSIKPTLYLKYNIIITDGNGSESNPYILELI